MAARSFDVLRRLTDLAALGRALDAFGREAGLGEEPLADVRLAVDEAVSNAFRHGGAAEIRVRADVDDRRVQVEIADDGRAFNPLEAPLPDVARPVEERPTGGLGVLLLRAVMDELAYRRADGKNVLTLSRRRG
jgi:serine/threonine-protein kinase RsbW